MTLVRRFVVATFAVATFLVTSASAASAQQSWIAETVRDETGAALPGVLVEARAGVDAVQPVVTDERGQYRFVALTPASVDLAFTLTLAQKFEDCLRAEGLDHVIDERAARGESTVPDASATREASSRGCAAALRRTRPVSTGCLA